MQTLAHKQTQDIWPTLEAE